MATLIVSHDGAQLIPTGAAFSLGVKVANIGDQIQYMKLPFFEKVYRVSLYLIATWLTHR